MYVANPKIRFATLFPHELVHNKIIIPVTINGVKTKYIVDTGGKTGTMYDIAP